jgi:pyruvate ferredoxin oxidoreductase alpha subunit
MIYKNMSKTEAKKQILEGSNAIALTIKNIAPEVVSAYPITPQTHIVEDLANYQANGEADFQYLRAESEFAAASIVLGASAAGTRVYSATSSQGLLLMNEVIYSISGMRLPVVMTCANRAISSPINIWNDHSDVMSIRDAGWLQFFASDNQEAIYQHLLAYKIAETLELPAMVNVDGFILTHSYEAVSIPEIKTIKAFLPKRPLSGYRLDPKNPITMGAFFGPAYYLETREKLHLDLIAAKALIKKEYAKLQKLLGNKKKSGDDGLIEYIGPKQAKNIIIAMGSVNGTIEEEIKNKKDVGLLKIKVFRPFPDLEIIKQLKKAKNVAVIDKALSIGQSGPLYADIVGLDGLENKNIKNYIAGLGGRNISQKTITKIITDMQKRGKKINFVKSV